MSFDGPMTSCSVHENMVVNERFLAFLAFAACVVTQTPPALQGVVGTVSNLELF